MYQSSRIQKQSYVVHQKNWHPKNDLYTSVPDEQMLSIRNWHPKNDFYTSVPDEQMLPIRSIDSPQLLDQYMMFNNGLYQDEWPGTNGHYNHLYSEVRFPTNCINVSQFPNTRLVKNSMVNSEYDEAVHEVVIPVAMKRTQVVIREHRSWSNGHRGQIYDENGDFAWTVKVP